MKTETSIRFILNSDDIERDVVPGMLALDFIRDQQGLAGTKEGCREGDCGACIVLVGQLDGGGMKYRPMTACLIPMGELDGKHLVTIEGIEREELSAVQTAMVDCGGTQCGYCTPGFIMSMTGWIIDPSKPLDSKGLNDAISGNLCRCTGYGSIRRSGRQVADMLETLVDRDDRIAALCEHSELPDYFLGIEKRLREMSNADRQSYSHEEGAIPIAGGTDLYIQEGDRLHQLPINLIQRASPIETVKAVDNWIQVDARMSFESFADDSIVQGVIPDIQKYNTLIASWPIRVRATLGGNLCNASPIGDMTCLLLALDAEIILADGIDRRSLPLSEFYLGYRKVDKSPREILTTIRFPRLPENAFINWEKVSKRRCQDIASVNSALCIRVENNIITTAKLSMGGVAPTPLLLKKTNTFLEGKEISTDVVMDAASMAQEEFSPMSDTRGSADYKRLLARQLIIAHFIKGFPDIVKEEDVYEALR